MTQEQLSELLEKYKQGKLTPEQVALLETWYVQEFATEKPKLTEKEVEVISERVRLGLPITVGKPRRLRMWPYISAAASIAVIVVGAYFYQQSNKEVSNPNVVAVDVAPGIQTATLTLANGSKIRLANAANGELAKEAGVSIIKTANGQLIYEIKNSSNQTNKINTLSTANGETYRVRLPDGTAAWLNAASSISYPASFASLKTRNVTTTGEVYFEVAKDRQHPFIVESKGQTVEVLGTHFNVNSYAEEGAIKTTLLEGSVRLKGDKGQVGMLKPGEQATLASDGQLKVAEGDVQLAVAWKNNKFMFESQQITDIMRMIERWYDVKVVYEGAVPDDRFSGKVSRYSNVSQVLRLLEQSGGVHFRIADRGVEKVIYVTK